MGSVFDLNLVYELLAKIFVVILDGKVAYIFVLIILFKPNRASLICF